jgi:hypothetical protein
MTSKMDPGLKKVLIAGCTLVGAAIVKHNVDRFKKVVADHEKKEPWASLMYKLGRGVLVCPNKRCGHLVVIKTFETQCQDNWECNQCGCVWHETSHCDVIIKEGV